MKPAKTIRLGMLAVASGLLFSLATSLAQSGQAETVRPGGSGRGPEARQFGPGPRASIDQRVQRLTQMLNLTPEQQAKLRAILEEEQKKLQELRTNTAIAPAEQAIKIREIRDGTNEKIREMLTPEQRERFESMPRLGLGQGPRPELQFGIDQRVRRMSETLNLTPDQQAKVRTILEEERNKMRELRADATLTPEQRRTKMRELAQESNNKIRQILTSEQKEKFDAMPRAQFLGPADAGEGTNRPAGPAAPRGTRAGVPERPAAAR
ncbi:MAG: Spy/CpxP family protein refolding chaperone [Verrucomicrobiae bacterium]|nr:Spy/CpxP family protein refolding chaperone [Verrucomicrobiae bacterium]